jgi:hypothetical protein
MANAPIVIKKKQDKKGDAEKPYEGNLIRQCKRHGVRFPRDGLLGLK